MKKYCFSISSLLFTFYIFLTSTAIAITLNAESCSLSHVQSAINVARTGDAVVLPAGSSTWNSTLSIPNDKKITIQGSGIGNTIITRNSYGTFIKLNKSGSRITAIEFVEGKIEADGYDFRIDHCQISLNVWSDGISVMSRDINPPVISTGLIDNCIFNNMRILVCGTNWMLSDNNAQHVLWSSPLGLGTAEAVYIEDNTFNGGHSVIDGNYAGRYVFRHNTVNDASIDAHSVQGNNRAIRKWEIYNNTINQEKKSMWVPMFIRGGTGVIFNNVVTGTWTNPNIAFDNVRSCLSRGDGGMCDGNSSWDGNEANQIGYPCRDQIGRSTDKWLWTTEKPYPPQALDPAYIWNNKWGNSDVAVFQHNCSTNALHIQKDRDFYLNIPKPGYTPYIYPHPLRASDKNKPSAPTGFKKI